MTQAGIAALADALDSIEAPDELNSLAARAAAIAVTADLVGALCMAHALLLLLARRADDSLDPEQWRRIRTACARLADLLRNPDVPRLDAVGDAWLDLARPSALQ